MGWVELSIAAGLIAFFITVLVDMFSRAFSLTSAAMWAKSEYGQVAATFAIILLASSMETVGNGITGEIAGQVAFASGNVELKIISQNPLYAGFPTRMAKAYLGKVIECEATIYQWVYWINLFVEAFSKISFDVAHLEGIGAGIALTGWVTLFHYIMNNIVYLVLFHYMQYDILQLSEYAMLSVFLPIGLVMRAFPLTRGAGGFVVAFAIGFAFVFPMTYVMIIAMMPSAEIPCSKIAVDALPENTPFGMQDPCLNNAGSVMDNYYKIKNSEEKITGIVDYAQSTLGLLVLEAVFYPLAALIIALSFVRQTGSLFGADLAEIGRGLIKLI